MSKYVPAIFQPTVRPSWAGILSYVSVEEKSQILEAIIKYPTDTGIKSKFWEETIKPDLEMQYTKFVKANEAKGCGSRTYWSKGEDKDKISLPYDSHMDNISIRTDKDIKDKDKDNNNRGNCKGGEEKYGSLKNVILEKEQYKSLKEKHPNIDDAIEELDTWLGKNSKSAKEARGKNHYAYFKSNSWVWERLGEQRKPTESVDTPDTGEKSVLVEEGQFYIDDTMPEYRENCQKLTDVELEKAWKWIMDHFRGKKVSVDFVNGILKKFDSSCQFREAQGF